MVRAQAAMGMTRDQIRTRLEALSKLANQAIDDLGDGSRRQGFWSGIEAIEKLADELGMLTEIRE